MNIILIGAGNMGSAILGGLRSQSIDVYENDSNKKELLEKEFSHIRVLTDTLPNVEGKVVILAVKPHIFPLLTLEGTPKAIVSIMAGVTLASLKERFPNSLIIRYMPNLAAMNAKSVTAVTGDNAFKDEALVLLQAIGKTVWVGSEKELDIATALSGSGPAYLALIAEGLEDGAVRMGLSRDSARAFTQGLFEGFSSLMENDMASVIKDKTMSPGGTTAQGYAVLEEKGVRSACMKAVEAAFNQAQALGKKG